MLTPAAIREVVVDSGEDLVQQLSQWQEPLVLRGLAANWPAVKAARQSGDAVQEYLGQLGADVPVNVSVGPADIRGRIFYNAEMTGFNFELKRVQFGALLDALRRHQDDGEPPVIYMGSTPVDYCLPGFREANDLALQELNPIIRAWIGNQTRIAAHYDIPDNIACVVAGNRTFTLFPPSQLENLYVGPLDFAPAGQAISLVDFHHPDFEKFPKFREALKQARRADLAPGDGLFIPSMWWHHVEGHDSFNMLVNYWWRSVPPYLGSPLDVLHHALLSLRALPRSQRDAWRGLFEHYVFNADDSVTAHIPEQSQGLLAPLDEMSARKLRALLLKQLNR